MVAEVAEKTFPFFSCTCAGTLWEGVPGHPSQCPCRWGTLSLASSRTDGGVMGCSLLSFSSHKLILLSFSLQHGQFNAVGSCLEFRNLEAALKLFWQCSFLQQQARGLKVSRQ